MILILPPLAPKPVGVWQFDVHAKFLALSPQFREVQRKWGDKQEAFTAFLPELNADIKNIEGNIDYLEDKHLTNQ